MEPIWTKAKLKAKRMVNWCNVSRISNDPPTVE
jgi:hypothetical protein